MLLHLLISLLFACLIHASYNLSSPEALASRTYFYVGGRYINATGGHIFVDQMYVEQLLPAGNATLKDPVVFHHGQVQTGTNWLNTPDGRQGWASWFLQQGHPVYILDQPQRGRSPAQPGNGSIATWTAELIESLFTGVEHFGGWPQAHLHTQWPGTGLMGDPIFDTFYQTQVEFQNDPVIVEVNNRAAGAALLARIGRPVIWIGHSQAGPLSVLVADARPDLIKALVIIEPVGPPFQNKIPNLLPPGSNPWVRPYGLTTTPLVYDPPVTDPGRDLPSKDVPPPQGEEGMLFDCILQQEPAKKLVNVSQVPMLVVWGEASFHATYDYCTVNYLVQGGVDATALNLSAAGVHGNAHFVFLEENSIQIAEMIYGWVKGKVGL